MPFSRIRSYLFRRLTLLITLKSQNKSIKIRENLLQEYTFFRVSVKRNFSYITGRWGIGVPMKLFSTSCVNCKKHRKSESETNPRGQSSQAKLLHSPKIPFKFVNSKPFRSSFCSCFNFSWARIWPCLSIRNTIRFGWNFTHAA